MSRTKVFCFESLINGCPVVHGKTLKQLTLLGSVGDIADKNDRLRIATTIGTKRNTNSFKGTVNRHGDQKQLSFNHDELLLTPNFYMPRISVIVCCFFYVHRTFLIKQVYLFINQSSIGERSICNCELGKNNEVNLR